MEINHRLGYLATAVLLCLSSSASAWDNDKELPDLGTSSQTNSSPYTASAGVALNVVGGEYSRKYDAYTVTSTNFSLSRQDGFGLCPKISGSVVRDTFRGPPNSGAYDTYVFDLVCTQRIGNVDVDAGRLFPLGSGDSSPVLGNTGLFRMLPPFLNGWTRIDGLKLQYPISDVSSIAVAYGIQDGLPLGHQSDQAKVASLRLQKNWLTFEATDATGVSPTYTMTLTPPEQKVGGLYATPYLYGAVRSNDVAAVAQIEFASALSPAQRWWRLAIGAFKNLGDVNATGYVAPGLDLSIGTTCAIRTDATFTTLQKKFIGVQMTCQLQ